MFETHVFNEGRHQCDQKQRKESGYFNVYDKNINKKKTKETNKRNETLKYNYLCVYFDIVKGNNTEN